MVFGNSMNRKMTRGSSLIAQYMNMKFPLLLLCLVIFLNGCKTSSEREAEVREEGNVITNYVVEPQNRANDVRKKIEERQRDALKDF